MDGPMSWDASRVAAAIPSGVGFLGAGLIWKGSVGEGEDEVHQVHGLTTAASVWLSAAVGVGSGGGLYFICVYSVALIIVVLRFGPRMYGSEDSGYGDGETEGEDSSAWDTDNSRGTPNIPPKHIDDNNPDWEDEEAGVPIPKETSASVNGEGGDSPTASLGASPFAQLDDSDAASKYMSMPNLRRYGSTGAGEGESLLGGSVVSTQPLGDGSGRAVRRKKSRGKNKSAAKIPSFHS